MPDNKERGPYGLSPDEQNALPVPLDTREPISRRNALRTIVGGGILFVGGFTANEIKKPIFPLNASESNAVDAPNIPLTPEVTETPVFEDQMENIPDNPEGALSLFHEYREPLPLQIDHWTGILGEEDLERFFGQFGDDVKGSLFFSYIYEKSASQQLPIVLSPQPPQIRYEDGNFTSSEGAVSHRDQNDKKYFFLPGFDLGQVSLTTHIETPEDTFTRSHEVELVTHTVYPELSPDASEEAFRILTTTEIDPLQLIEIKSLQRIAERFKANLWRVVVSDTPYSGRIDITTSDGDIYNTNIFTVHSGSLPDLSLGQGLTNHAEKPALLQLTRDITEAILSPHNTPQDTKEKLKILQELCDKSYKATESLGTQPISTPPEFLTPFLIDSSEYNVRLFDLARNPLEDPEQSSPRAMRFIRDLAPLLRYMYPQMEKELEHLKQVRPDFLESAKPYISTAFDVLHSINTEASDELFLGNNKRLQAFLGL